MALQYGFSERFRSIAGGALVGIGLHLIFGNLDHAAVQFRHVLGTSAGESLGMIPSIVLETSQAVQAYGVDRHGFVLSVLQMLVSLWPAIFVIAGTVFLRDVVTEKVKAFPAPVKYLKKPAEYLKNAEYLKKKDAGCRFPCPSFDI